MTARRWFVGLGTCVVQIYDAFYKLTNHHQQIRAYVYDVVRTVIPTMTLDQSFEAKDDIAMAVKEHLKEVMDSYGFVIIQALVTDVVPDHRVKNAMNEINASRKMKEASLEKAEGEKVLKVKAAEADAESKYLSGVGVARQRKAIVDGLQESIVEFQGNVSGTNSKDVIDLLLLTQYFDMLKEVGNEPTCNTIFTSPASGGGSLQDAMMQADQIKR